MMDKVMTILLTGILDDLSVLFNLLGGCFGLD